MFAAFFAGSEYLQDFDELGGAGRDHYLILLKSLRGEKRAPSSGAASNDCPSLDTFGIDENERHAPSDFRFRNRDTSTLNMIFVNEYEMEKGLGVYAFFIRKYIYETVFFSYWIPISCAQIGLTAIIVLFIIWYVNDQVLKPIQEMSQMTEFILNPENNQKQGRIFQNLVEKVKLIERRYSQMESTRLGEPRTKSMSSKKQQEDLNSATDGNDTPVQSDDMLMQE